MNNNITGLFVTYEIALKLKEKGFNEQCLAFFNGVGDDMLQPIDTDFINFREIGECVAAPIWQQVIDWFGEKGIAIIQLPFTNRYGVAHKFKDAEESTFLGGYEKKEAILKALTLI